MNSKMSTTKENVIWEEKNLIELMKRLGNSGELDECGIITDTKEKLEKKILNDIIKEKTIIERNREYSRRYHSKNKEIIKNRRREKFLEKQKIRLEKILLKNPNPPSKICGMNMYYNRVSELNRSVNAPNT